MLQPLHSSSLVQHIHLTSSSRLCSTVYVPNVCQFHHPHINSVLLLLLLRLLPLLLVSIYTSPSSSSSLHPYCFSLSPSPRCFNRFSVVRFFAPSIEIPCSIHFIFPAQRKRTSFLISFFSFFASTMLLLCYGLCYVLCARHKLRNLFPSS